MPLGFFLISLYHISDFNAFSIIVLSLALTICFACDILLETTAVYGDEDMRIKAERDSVCLGDDCTAPNSEYILFESGIRLSELLLQIAQYVPDYSGRQHTIWGIEYKGEPIAFLECDENSKYKCILNTDDILADAMDEKKIYCRYFFDHHGNVSSNIKALFSSNHLNPYALLDYVKAYYALPESERWGWF